MERFRLPWSTGLNSVVVAFWLSPKVLLDAELHGGAGPIALLDADHPVLVRGDKCGGAGDNGSGFNLRLVCGGNRREKRRVEVRNRGSGQLHVHAAQDAAVAAARSLPLPVVPTVLDASTPSEAEVGSRRDVGRKIAQQLAGDGALQVRQAQFRLEARHFDIEVVFQRQRDRIAQRKIDVAGAHELFDAVGIRKVDLRSRGGRVGTGEPLNQSRLARLGEGIRLPEHG